MSTTKGTADTFGAGVEGTLSVNYELSGVNQPVAVQLPADCPSGMVDAPVLPSADDVVNMPGLLTYTTVTSLADAAAFYQQKLPALGWQLASSAVTTPANGLLEFTRADQQLSIIISSGDGITTVQIVLERLR